jgi:hypothetical protein
MLATGARWAESERARVQDVGGVRRLVPLRGTKTRTHRWFRRDAARRRWSTMKVKERPLNSSCSRRGVSDRICDRMLPSLRLERQVDGETGADPW